MCVGRKSLIKTTKMARLEISGRDLRTVVEETIGSAKRDLAKSRENTDPEGMG